MRVSRKIQLSSDPAGGRRAQPRRDDRRPDFSPRGSGLDTADPAGRSSPVSASNRVSRSSSSATDSKTFRRGAAETELVTIGLAACADDFSRSLAIRHVLARMGAQLILSPSAWAVDADHDDEREPYGKLWLDSFSELTRLYDLTDIGVSNVGRLTSGPWEGRKIIGCSLAIGPGGVVLARGPYGEHAEALVVVGVEPRPPIGRGTRIVGDLGARGYRGP